MNSRPRIPHFLGIRLTKTGVCVYAVLVQLLRIVSATEVTQTCSCLPLRLSQRTSSFLFCSVLSVALLVATVKSSLCTPSGGVTPLILDLSMGRWCVITYLGLSNLEDIALCSHWIESWVVLGASEKLCRRQKSLTAPAGIETKIPWFYNPKFSHYRLRHSCCRIGSTEWGAVSK